MAETRQSKLQLAWVNDLRTEDERKEFEQLVRNSVQVLSKLKTILEKRLEAIRIEEEDLNFYLGEVSSKQTFNAARRSEIKNILKLLSFLD